MQTISVAGLGGIAVRFRSQLHVGGYDCRAFGTCWADSLSASLAVQPNGDVLLRTARTDKGLLHRSARWLIRGCARRAGSLTAINGSYRLTRHDQVVYSFDGSGVLQSELDRNGQGIAFSYTGGKLTTVSNAVKSGRDRDARLQRQPAQFGHHRRRA